eukprot:m.351910 g.351910  ORF g.351910 m.351910 type:complete len:86 (+) comp16397_c0_seq1:550-807(+)
MPMPSAPRAQAILGLVRANSTPPHQRAPAERDPVVDDALLLLLNEPTFVPTLSPLAPNDGVPKHFQPRRARRVARRTSPLASASS